MRVFMFRGFLFFCGVALPYRKRTHPQINLDRFVTGKVPPVANLLTCLIERDNYYQSAVVVPAGQSGMQKQELQSCNI